MNSSLKALVRRVGAECLSRSGYFTARRWISDCTVLMYHRVIDPEFAPYPLQAGMYVRPETFRMQMKFLREHCEVLALEDVISGLQQSKRLPKRTVVLTFDDGWIDNVTNAFPTLADLNLPATVFLPTAYIGTSDLFWTDAIALISSEPMFCAALTEAFSGRELLNRLRKETCSHGASLFTRQQQRADLESALRFCFAIDPAERNAVVETVSNILGANLQRLPRQFMGWDDVRAQTPRIRFGSHSHSHSLYGELSFDEATADYAASRAVFAREQVSMLECFCYPGGSWTESSQQALASSGVEFVAVTSRTWNLSSSPKQIGRTGVHQDVSYTPALFASRLWGGGRW